MSLDHKTFTLVNPCWSQMQKGFIVQTPSLGIITYYTSPLTLFICFEGKEVLLFAATSTVSLLVIL